MFCVSHVQVCRALERSGVGSLLIDAVRDDELDGRSLAELDDEYLLECAGTTFGPMAAVAGGSGGRGERLKRKSFLTLVRQWSERGVPPELTAA